MKTLLAKLTPKRAIGLAIDDREVVLSLMAFTPIGPRELERRAEPIGDETPAAALRRVLGPVVAGKLWRKAPVAVGLPCLDVFFSTRPIKAKGDAASAQMLLHEVLQSPNVIIDDMAVDLIRSQPCRQPVASIVACRKKALAPILEALADCGVRPTRVEPSPCGLLRAATALRRAPRRAKTVLRIFLGRAEALAVLAVEGRPVMWRAFAVGAGAEAGAILSAYRAMGNLCRYCGIESAIDAVMVHGRPDLADLEAEPDWAQLPAKTWRSDGPGYDGGPIAEGLALGCRNPEVEAFNLARDVAPAVPISGLLPWGHLAIQATLLIVATLLLANDLRGLERSRAVVHAGLAEAPRAKGRTIAQLREEKKALAARVGAMQRYLEGRILWTECIREVSANLPEAMTATSFDGECKYEPKPNAKSKPKRSFRVAVEVPTPGDGAIPPEVREFLDSLRGAEPLRRALPSIEMAGLRWGPSGQTRVPTASFTVVCEPEAAKVKTRR